MDTASNAPPHPPEARSASAAAASSGDAAATSTAASTAHREARSLFGEILDWMLAPLLLLWPISLAVTYLVAQSIAGAPFDRQLGATVAALTEQVREVDGKPTLGLSPTARALLNTEGGERLYVQLRAGHHLFIEGDPDLPAPSAAEPVETGVTKYRDALLRGAEVRIAYSWLERRNGALKTPVLLQVAQSGQKRAQLASEIVKGVMIPQFVILPIAVLLAWFGLARGIAPLQTLQAKIRARRPDDLSPIALSEAPHEVTPLVAAFNDLLQRLDRSLSVHKRFVADAAHQMKTPLAGLRMQAELAMRHSQNEEARRSLKQMVTSVERTTHLINQLLALARAENREALLQRSELLDLRAVALRETRERVPEALAKEIDLGLEEPAYPVLVRGHAWMLNELLKNLLDNALRYTPAGGRVTVRVQTDDYRRYAILEVEDTGPGIPEAERAAIFDRFYRILGSNVAGSGEGNVEGSGIGLAIVREIAEQHGADITVSHNPRAVAPEGPGTLFGVRFALEGEPIATGGEY